MRKIICAVLVAVLIPVVALADVDLSSMSFDELVQLSKNVTAEIISRPEWKEVEVPTGTWTVGVDIPAGIYSVRPVRSSANLSARDENGKLKISLLCFEDSPVGRVELINGWTVSVSLPLIFAPPMTLGF